MNLTQRCPRLLAMLGVLVVIGLGACGKRDGDSVTAGTPKEAAAGLDAAFSSAPTAVQENVRLVSQAMRDGHYDQAVVSLQVVRSQENLSLEQGMAIQGSILTLEQQLVQGVQSGDPNAKRAYELLKALKRK